VAFRPLKITAILENGICGNSPYFPLDGALQLAAVKREYGEDLPPVEKGIIYPSNMPLEIRYPDSPYWYYAISFAQYEERTKYIQYWHKRFREKYLDLLDPGRKSRIDTQSGPYRAYRMPLITYVVSELEWYAIGDPDGIADLLSDITYLGKKRAYGNGRVLEWKIEPISEDWSEIKDGRWTRAIPHHHFENKLMDWIRTGYRPPYWHPSCIEMCTMPGSPAKRGEV
jgi:hypothetical protein